MLFAATLIVSISWASAIPGRNVPPKLKNEVIPREAQVLTGAALVDYVNNHQQLFKVEPAAAIDELMMKIMKPKFINQNKKPCVDEVEDDNLEIPDRQVE
ncbi:unnamed protein product [Angiostrongylus costaricensis]|uniref:Secreted protein n=1 Tax=Angiostrongylus costaricensis TaxID=334426 RepID=A0A0R3PAM8_ANGCS|nr:unnamed protein product [Angiostrongylus costaricensis]